MSYDTDLFRTAAKKHLLNSEAIEFACGWLKDAFAEGYDEAEDDGHHDNHPPDIGEELGWLRTRIMRGETDDALKLVDEIHKELSHHNNRLNSW